MQITLKNVKINETFSEETTMFMADVYADNKKFAHAKNDGRGGCSYIHHYDGCKELMREAEEACFLMRSRICTDFGEPFEIKSTLDSVVDDLIEEHRKNKFQKAMMKDCEKGIVYGVNCYNYNTMTWKGFTIAQLLKHPRGQGALGKAMNEIKAELKDGEQIFNTNLNF